MRPKGILRIKLEKRSKLESICFFSNSRLMPKGAQQHNRFRALATKPVLFYP